MQVYRIGAYETRPDLGHCPPPVCSAFCEEAAVYMADIEQSAPFPVVGGGWITRARKIPYTRPVGEHLGIGDLEQPNPGRGAARQPSRRP